MNTILWCVGTFVLGLVLGWSMRELVDMVRGRTDGVDIIKRIRSGRVSLLTASLVLSMVFTALVGVLLIINDNRDQQRTSCITEYNRLSAEARDARLQAQNPAEDARLQYIRDDLRFQRILLNSLNNGAVDENDALANVTMQRITVTEAFLARLENQRDVRIESDYPPANFCE